MATGLIEPYLRHSFNWVNGAPGLWRDCGGRSANCGYDLFAQYVRLRSEINYHAPHVASPVWCPVPAVLLQVAL